MESFLEKLDSMPTSVQSVQGVFRFEPLVRIEDLANPAARVEATEIIQRVKEEHVPEIDKRLSHLFEQEVIARMPYASKQLRQEMWASWLPVHYFTVIKAVTMKEKRPRDIL